MNTRRIGPNSWQVESRSHPGTWHDVERDGDLWCCTCPACQKGGHRCAHIKHLADCPACQGRGYVEIRSFVWFEETGERAPSRLPCAICGGSREAQPTDALPSDAALREIFA